MTLNTSIADVDPSDQVARQSVLAFGICGDMRHPYGPYDYTNYEHFTEKLPIVELHHFTFQVESLEKGITGSLLGDIDYTIRTFPNHHRALNTLSRFEFAVDDAEEQIEENLPIDCYFQHAIEFKPTDGVVRLIYGTYLHKKGNYERDNKLLQKALIQYNHALELMPESADVHYNLGLYYLDTNKLNLALSHGHRAYELGFPLEGLKDKLKQKGLWNKTVSQN